MSLLDHALSLQTLELIERVVELTDYRLVIYASHCWAMENPHRTNAIAFDPKVDSAFLQGELRIILQYGHV